MADWEEPTEPIPEGVDVELDEDAAEPMDLDEGRP